MILKITEGKGFHMVFESGWTLSVQIGPGNYCENYDKDWSQPLKPSSTCEIAVWHENGQWLFRDDVVGYLPCAALPAIIAQMARTDASDLLPRLQKVIDKFTQK